jgi:hypothetical protein
MTKHLRHEHLALLVALAILSAVSHVGSVLWLNFLQGDKTTFFVALLPLVYLFWWAYKDREHGFPILQGVIFGFYALGWVGASVVYSIKNFGIL